jgi:hypothetical protein
MSINLLGMVEVLDRKSCKWEYAPLYRMHKESGLYVGADMFRGQRSFVDAVFGHDVFDFIPDEEFSKLSGLATAVEDIVYGARRNSTEGLSEMAKTKLEMSYETDHIPTFMCYTGRDVSMLSVLAEQWSDRAHHFFNQYFGNIVAVLDVVGASYDVYDNRDIRVILYAV